MNLYMTYSKTEVQDAANRELQIVRDYDTNLAAHLGSIKRRILLDDNTLLSIISALNAGFHVILYGPPGTAKSTISEFLPVELYGAKCSVHTADSEWNVRKVIGGITVSYDTSTTPPTERISPRDGYIVDDIFACYESRLETTDFDTAFTIIDEFNRTNMDECLGPMFTAMGSDHKILKLDYNKGFNDDLLEVPVPKGYRIICTMNKYDRTFTNELSDALSRRFKWIYIGAPDASEYSREESIVKGNVFGRAASITPVRPVNLVDVPACSSSDFLEKNVVSKIFAVINDLRADLEIGTSYKIDAVKLACHFFELKMKLVDWTRYAGVTEAGVKASGDIASAVARIPAGTSRDELQKILSDIVDDTIDAALVMTVVPACEATEDIDAINKNKTRFALYKRCTRELKRMRQSF